LANATLREQQTSKQVIFEVAANEIDACNRLEFRHPDAQIWIVRVGSRYVRRFGGWVSEFSR
jgi:hypothetical protein